MDQQIPTVIQVRDDRAFIQNLRANNERVVDQAEPERTDAVMDILERQVRWIESGRRRGGPTRDDLWAISDLCPGEAQVTENANKLPIVRDLIRRRTRTTHKMLPLHRYWTPPLRAQFRRGGRT